MSPKDPWHHRSLIVALAALGLALSGCFLQPKKKKSKKPQGASDLVIIEENGVSAIYLDRIGDGDAARLQFKTRAPALCELAYYAQDPAIEPKKEAPRAVPCSSAEPRQEFVEKIAGLRTDTLYNIVIWAWPVGSSKEAVVPLTVAEKPMGAVDDLLVARFNMPLRVAEFHRHRLPDGTNTFNVREKLARQIGCRRGVPNETGPFRAAERDIDVTALVTKDFAAGSAAAHPDHTGRLQISYPSLNDGLDKWSLLYQRGGRDMILAARPMSQIQGIEMQSVNSLSIDSGQLAEAVDPLVIDSSKPLKFSWTTSTLVEHSYLTVQIGRPDYDKSIYCVWPAAKRTGTIDPSLIRELDDGRHVVSAELASAQLWAKEGWLVTTYDWRSGRIEK